MTTFGRLSALKKCVGVECKALGGTFSQMVSLSILGILHYVKNDVPLIMSHLVPVPPRPSKKWGLCPTNSGFVHAYIDTHV